MASLAAAVALPANIIIVTNEARPVENPFTNQDLHRKTSATHVPIETNDDQCNAMRNLFLVSKIVTAVLTNV